MKRIFLALLIAAPLRMLAANGDITGVTVRSDGWSADVYISGLGTNGSYSYGLGSNNALTGSEKLRIALTSQGFDDTGTVTTVPRIVVGTKRVRKPYPDDLAGDETLDAGVLRVRIALSDYVYSADSNLTATLVAGLYSQGGTNSAASSSVTVTNSSTVAYPKPIANWSWPGWQLLNTTTDLRVVAFHRHGQSGRPVRAVKFTLIGGGLTNTAISTRPEIVAGAGDAVPVQEYVGRVDTSGFTNGTIVTTHFAAYPWIGDAASVLDTSDAVNGNPTPLYARQTNVVDRLGTYGYAVAVVATNGNDSTGVATTRALFSTNSPPAAFLTINKAAKAIQGTNNTLYGRNQAEGIIYVHAGDYSWAGSANSVSGTGYTWLEVKPYPGESTRLWNITNAVSDKHVGAATRTKVVGASITSPILVTFDVTDNLWVDDCYINSTAGALFYQVNDWRITRSTIQSMSQGIRPYSTENMPPCLIRGNVISNLSAISLVYTVLGNYSAAANSSGATWSDWFANQGPPMSVPIFAFNYLVRGTNNQAAALTIGQGRTNTVGAAIVCNVFEQAGTVTQPAMQVAADGATATSQTVDNVTLWHNTATGQRVNLAYCDTTTATPSRSLWSMRGNLFEDGNIKTDTFTIGNGARIGNWPAVWGVGSSGNAWAENFSAGAAGSFGPEFIGLNSYLPTTTAGTPIGSGTNAVTWIRFVDRQSYIGTGGSAAAGFGNYRLLSDSPVIGRESDWAIPFDLFGNARGQSDPPGAISSASPRKSGGFFQ
mgnify:CR=1 FL=1